MAMATHFSCPRAHIGCDFQFALEGECLQVRSELNFVVGRHDIGWQALKRFLLLRHGSQKQNNTKVKLNYSTFTNPSCRRIITCPI